MRLLLTADLHFGCTTHSSIDPETQVPTRILDFERSVTSIFGWCADNRIGRFALPGDIYHVNDPPATYVARTIDLVREGGRACRGANPDFELHAFDGNHDFNGRPGKRDATAPLVEALKDEPWFRWYGRRTLVEDFAPGVRALFIPHGSKRRADALEDDSKTNLVFCHTTIQGAVSGVEETLLADRVRDLGSITGRVDAYLSGHIHKAQVFYYQGALVVYPGSPERIDFGERGDQKSFAVIDLDRLRSEREAAVQAVPLVTRPFVQIDLAVDAGWLPEAHVWPPIKDAVVKVVVHVHERHVARFNANVVRDLLFARGANYVSGFSMDIERERAVRDSKMNERLTPVDALARYVNLNLPQVTAEEQEVVRRVLAEGSRILMEAARAR